MLEPRTSLLLLLQQFYLYLLFSKLIFISYFTRQEPTCHYLQPQRHADTVQDGGWMISHRVNSNFVYRYYDNTNKRKSTSNRIKLAFPKNVDETKFFIIKLSGCNKMAI